MPELPDLLLEAAQRRVEEKTQCYKGFLLRWDLSIVISNSKTQQLSERLHLQKKEQPLGHSFQLSCYLLPISSEFHDNVEIDRITCFVQMLGLHEAKYDDAFVILHALKKVIYGCEGIFSGLVLCLINSGKECIGI